MKRDEIDTDPSSPQSRRGSTEPGLGARGRNAVARDAQERPERPGAAAVTPAPAAPVYGGSADSIDEILEGITSRPRDSAPVTPRVTAATSGEAAAAYSSRARTPSPETTTPGPRPAVIVSPSVETLLDDKAPSSLPRPMVRDATPRPMRVASAPRLAPHDRALQDRAIGDAARGSRNDVDTVLTPSARFKRFLRRAVLSSVVLAVVLLTMASWKNNRHASRENAPPPDKTEVRAASAPPPAETPIAPANPPAAPVNAPTTTAAVPATPPAAEPPPARAQVQQAASQDDVHATNTPVIARAGARVPPKPSPAPSAKSSATSTAAASPPPAPAPGYDDFKKSFTP